MNSDIDGVFLGFIVANTQHYKISYGQTGNKMKVAP